MQLRDSRAMTQVRDGKICTTLKKLFAIYVLALASASCGVAQNPETLYGGKPESYWVTLLTNSQSREFNIQWRALGTNDISVLGKAIAVQGTGKEAAIRTNAAYLLSERAPVDMVLNVATNHTDPEVRYWALNGLVGRNALTPTALIRFLQDKDPKVRRLTLVGIGTTRTPELFTAFLKCLQDSDIDIRAGALQRLIDPYRPWRDKSEEQVRDAILTEIRNAANNPNPEISAPAAKAIKDKKSFIETYASELAIKWSAVHGNEWRVALEVTDEAAHVIPNARVWVGYTVVDRYGGKIEGTTDSNGMFFASHKDVSRRISFGAQKPGYYSTQGQDELYQRKETGMASNSTPGITIVLKRILDPIPMCVNKLDLAHIKPAVFDTPLGFDVRKGDWVAPYGKGTTAHLFFNWHADITKRPKASREIGETTLTITFPNRGDGIQEFRVPQGPVPVPPPHSELRSPQQAPLNGYQPKLVKFDIYRPGVAVTNNYEDLNINYIFRVQTVLDEKGEVKNANYGKIYGDFNQDVLIYFNPTTNSRSLEFDGKTNLGGDRSASTWPY